MTTPEQIAADLARLEVNVTSMLADGIEQARADLADLAVPPGSVVLEGPSWSPPEYGPLDTATIHDGFDVDAVHGTEGIHNLEAVAGGIRWRAKGQPAHVRESRAQAWLPIPEVDTVVETFDFRFDSPFDFGSEPSFRSDR